MSWPGIYSAVRSLFRTGRRTVTVRWTEVGRQFPDNKYPTSWRYPDYTTGKWRWVTRGWPTPKTTIEGQVLKEERL